MSQEITANKIVREKMKESNYRQWMIADLLGVSEWTLCRKLRKELPEIEQRRIVNLINEDIKKKESK